MKSPLIYLILAAVISSAATEAQQNPSPAPQPATVAPPPCTPPEVWKRLHPESSRAVHKLLGYLGNTVDKGTGGLVSGPTMEDVRKEIPPPCPVVPARPVPPPAPITANK